MKRLRFFLVTLSVVSLNIVGYGAKSYSSSYDPLTSSFFEYTQEEADCLAWKFTLAATLLTMVRRTHASFLDKKLREDDKYGYIKPVPAFDVDEIFPAKKAKNIISTIIKKEGGSCSRELLYDTPCAKNIPYGPVHGGGPSYTSYLSAEIKIKYFAQIIGVPLDQDRISELDAFLRDHMSKSPNTKASFYGLDCEREESPCVGVGGRFRDGYFRFITSSNFGFCILKKHKLFLKENNIFDVEANNYIKNFHKFSFDQDSLKSFIKRSNEIAEEAADSH